MLYGSGSTPRLGFGLGRLHHVFSARKREWILLTAVEAGLTHFDLAAAYGDGFCEAEAGRILRRHRSQITLATKFGIPCGSSGEGHPWLYFARKGLRKAFSRSYGSEYGERDFSAGAAVRAVEDSLRRLRTDYIDCLFFHEPRHSADAEVIGRAVEAMERLKAQGKIRSYGVSARTDYFLSSPGSIAGDIVQFELDEDSPALADRLPAHLRSSAFGLVRFYGRYTRSGERLDYTSLLGRFFETYPNTMPILASNRPDAIRSMGRAAEMLGDQTVSTRGARRDARPYSTSQVERTETRSSRATSSER